MLLILVSGNPSVDSIDSLNGENISEQYKEGLQHGSGAGGQEILPYSGTLRTIYCTLKPGRQSQGKGGGLCEV